MTDLPRTFGAYTLLKALGQGGMGSVYLARPRDPGRGLPSPLIIKCLHGRLGAKEEFVQRFRHEAAIAVSVDSPHVAKVYDVGAVDETFYIAMEYIAGRQLSELVEALGAEQRFPPIAETVELFAGALRGVIALHTARDPRTGQALEIVHRDLSPKNIMVGEDGIARLIDLGLGKSRAQEWRTGTGVVMGTPGYMAPEQLFGRPLDHRADLYAMGLVLFEMLTLARFIPLGPLAVMVAASARAVFVPPSARRAEVPPALDAVVQRAMAPDPKDRFQSAAEMLEATLAAAPGAARASRSLMVGLFQEMFAPELAETRRAVAALVDTQAYVHDTQSNILEPTYVIALREGVRPPANAPVAPSAPELSGSMFRTQPSLLPPRRRSPLLIGAGAVALVALGVLADRAVLRFSAAPAPAVTPVEAPAPEVRARPRPVEAQVAPPEEDPPAKPERTAPRPRPRPATAAPPEPEEHAAAQAEPPPPPEVTDESLLAAMKRITQLGSALKSGGADAAEIDRALERAALAWRRKDLTTLEGIEASLKAKQ